MQAIEFQTILHNGTVTVTLPPEYSSQWEGKTVRTIVSEDSVSNSSENPAQSTEQPQTARFKAIALNTQGLEFSREDANAR
jgi:hypothetical protein